MRSRPTTSSSSCNTLTLASNDVAIIILLFLLLFVKLYPGANPALEDSSSAFTPGSHFIGDGVENIGVPVYVESYRYILAVLRFPPVESFTCCHSLPPLFYGTTVISAAVLRGVSDGRNSFPGFSADGDDLPALISSVLFRALHGAFCVHFVLPAQAAVAYDSANILAHTLTSFVVEIII